MCFSTRSFSCYREKVVIETPFFILLWLHYQFYELVYSPPCILNSYYVFLLGWGLEGCFWPKVTKTSNIRWIFQYKFSYPFKALEGLEFLKSSISIGESWRHTNTKMLKCEKIIGKFVFVLVCKFSPILILLF
jgi:hypothetical protein